jgi:hypothetical protein
VLEDISRKKGSQMLSRFVLTLLSFDLTCNWIFIILERQGRESLRSHHLQVAENTSDDPCPFGSTLQITRDGNDEIASSSSHHDALWSHSPSHLFM